MKIRPCPICQTAMVIRKTGSQSVSSEHPEFFIYCRHCGYGPTQTFGSIEQAAKHWAHESLSDCVH